MKIYVYPADNWGCGKYRMWWPAEALIAQGHDVTTVTPGDSSGIGGFTRNGKMQSVFYPPDANVIVLQRPSHGGLVEAIPLMQAEGVYVVVDMDDDLSNIHPANPAFQLLHPRVDPKSNWQNVAVACRHANLVTVSTDALVPRYGSHGRVVVLRNCIPERFLKIGRDDSGAVGWAGALHSHPDDPRALGPALAQLRTTLQVVGPDDPGLPRAFGVPCEATGIVDFEEWGEHVATIGIGIAPLMNTRFNECKSWLKPLEYSALGVPWIGSISHEYSLLHKMGCGAIASKPKEWRYQLQRLMNSAQARQELSEAGRMVASTLTIEGNAWRWMEAWEGATKRRAAGR